MFHVFAVEREGNDNWNFWFVFFPKMAVSWPLTGFVFWFAETPIFIVFRGCAFFGSSCHKRALLDPKELTHRKLWLITDKLLFCDFPLFCWLFGFLCVFLFFVSFFIFRRKNGFPPKMYLCWFFIVSLCFSLASFFFSFFSSCIYIYVFVLFLSFFLSFFLLPCFFLFFFFALFHCFCFMKRTTSKYWIRKVSFINPLCFLGCPLFVCLSNSFFLVLVFCLSCVFAQHQDVMLQKYKLSNTNFGWSCGLRQTVFFITCVL